MKRKEYDLNPVQGITAGAVGEPGHRVFYIQAYTSAEIVTLIAEKEQVRMLARGILQLLGEIHKKHPGKTDDSPIAPLDLELQVPFQPDFRVERMELGYEAKSDLIVLIAHELVEEDIEAEANQIEGTGSLARLWATCAQMRAMADHALEVAARGRPICPLCGRAHDAEDNVCPRRNGHHRTSATL